MPILTIHSRVNEIRVLSEQLSEVQGQALSLSWDEMSKVLGQIEMARDLLGQFETALRKRLAAT